MPERICIVGCGAIGGLYAAHLAQLPDLEVWAYDASADHVAAINERGLRITGHLELLARIQARTDATQIPPCPLGILATKGTVTEAAITATAAVFADGAVCSVQNGIGNEELIAGQVPRVMRGVTLPAGRIAEPGVIHMDAPGPTWIGPFEPRSATAAEITALAALLNASGMETHAEADVRGAQWTKLLFNSSTNPLCALTGLTHGQLCTHPPTRELAGRLIEEGLAVAGALGIRLNDDPGQLIDEAARTNFNHRPSMLQDVSAHRRTEIATLNGGIVREAARAGLSAPLHASIVELILGLERGWTL
jgi:2-dehydropantoate 2-reductase